MLGDEFNLQSFLSIFFNCIELLHLWFSSMSCGNVYKPRTEMMNMNKCEAYCFAAAVSPREDGRLSDLF